MKPWSNRDRKDKLSRVLVSIFVLGVLAYGVPRFATDTYDWVTADECKAALTAAIDAGIKSNSAVSQSALTDAKAIGAAYAASAHQFAAAVAAPRGPTSIAGPQNELAAALEAYAETQEGQAATGNVNPTIRLAATEKVVMALRKVYPLIGMEEPG